MPQLQQTDAARLAAERLQQELKQFNISSDVNAGKGVAFVSVWADLFVWIHPKKGYWWWSGRMSPPGRKVYAFGAVNDPVGTARRIATRFAVAYAEHPQTAAIVEMLQTVQDGWEIPRMNTPVTRPMIEPL